jgi:hypothetical protein
MRRAICAVHVENFQGGLYYRKHDGIAQLYYEHVSNVVEKRNPYKSKNRRRLPEPTPASLLYPPSNSSYLSRTVKAVCW